MEAAYIPTEKMPERLILASASPRRRVLIESLGLRIPVEIVSSDADETTPDEWLPAKVVEQLAVRKAGAVRDRFLKEGRIQSPSVIVGADTIVVLDGDKLGKPADAGEAAAMLKRLQGRPHEVFTGVAVIDLQSGRTRGESRVTRVHMKPLDEGRIERYIASGEPMDKAGSYGIQGLGAVLVDRIEGCYFNVVGLPVSLLAELLADFGVETI
ncbi:Maf family protein [Paenibacillus tarimensis]|uniref:Maf family protein n=1 Tax=Paenibacillus tarimensis TaxID=416012 RepID=UPI002E1EE8A0